MPNNKGWTGTTRDPNKHLELRFLTEKLKQTYPADTTLAMSLRLSLTEEVST